MPLSKPVEREHIHTRNITCKGYYRDDGLWDIEGSITDTKTYSFANQDRGGINAGEYIHEMHVRLTVDGEFMIHNAQVVTDSSPFNICREITDSYRSLIGLQIKQGWRRDVLARFGRVKGCTHITDLLLGAIATTAYQTLGGEKKHSTKDQKANNATRLVNSCHALSSDGPVVRQKWADQYTGDDGKPDKKQG